MKPKKTQQIIKLRRQRQSAEKEKHRATLKSEIAIEAAAEAAAESAMNYITNKETELKKRAPFGSLAELVGVSQGA